MNKRAMFKLQLCFDKGLLRVTSKLLVDTISSFVVSKTDLLFVSSKE